MPRIRFTSEPKLARDLAHLGYHKDQEVDLSQDQADRWLRRGVAVIVPDDAPDDEHEETKEQLEAEVVAIPDDWHSQHHMARLALARRLTDEPVDHAADADRVIAAEVDRRAAEAAEGC